MGWSSAQDSSSSLRGRLCFPTQDDALSFVRNKGWELVYVEKTAGNLSPKSYQDNFRIVRPQDEEAWAYAQ